MSNSPQGPKQPRQYEPVSFGDPYNPKSVEGHHNAVRRAKFFEQRREREAEEAELDALAAARNAEIAARSPLLKLWDRLRRG